MELTATLLFNVFVYILGIFVVIRNGGIKHNLPFAFSILIFIIYHFITPVYFLLSGRETIWGDEGMNRNIGVDISDYYLIGLNYYALANLLFIIGYLLIRNNKKSSEVQQQTPQQVARLKSAVVISFIICFGIVLFNFLNEGLNPLLVLFGDNENVIAGKIATSNYLKNFSDSLIAIIIIGYFYKVKKPVLYGMTLLGFTIFALMGFRYRIILTLIGIVCVSLYISRPTRWRALRFMALGMVFMYFMFFITYNRFLFTRGEWNKMETNPLKFEYNLFFEQTRGMLDDITVIKYYDTHLNPRHDYGVTFLYFLVRIMPRSIVGDKFKDSFYPFPAYNIFTEAYDVQKNWGKRNTGEAPLHMAYFYIAGGLPILLLGSFLTGFIIKGIQIKFSPTKDTRILILILFTSALFQWYTRGYFPGFVDHLAFMLIGFWMTKYITRLPKVVYM